MTTKERVREFLRNNFYMAARTEVKDDASLLELGVVDSTGVLEIVNFLERDFGIDVLDREMVPENLDSIAAIAGFVEGKATAARLAV